MSHSLKPLAAAVAELNALHIAEADAAKCAGSFWGHSQRRLRSAASFFVSQ